MEKECVLVASTRHLSNSSRRYLDDLRPHKSGRHCWYDRDDGLWVTPYRHGWMVWVEPATPTKVPADLSQFLVRARAEGCHFLRFDDDAPVDLTIPIPDEDPT